MLGSRPLRPESLKSPLRRSCLCASSLCFTYAAGLCAVFQAIALSISPEVEHKAIKDGTQPVRFNWRHWLTI